MTDGEHMGTAAQPTRDHRTIIVDVQHETTSLQLRSDGKAFLAVVLAFLSCPSGFRSRPRRSVAAAGACLSSAPMLSYASHPHQRRPCAVAELRLGRATSTEQAA